MNEHWKSPNIILGSVATGGNFFRREDLEEIIWDRLRAGSSVQLTAPRRVGKTSIMQFMAKQSVENYRSIFDDIEGVSSANEFYERIYFLLLSCLNKMDKARIWVKKILKSRSITKISLDGIEWKMKPDDFLKETNLLLREINDNAEIENIVLFLDELPVLLLKMSKKKNEEATSILSNLRYWRQQPELNKKVRFVLAGSVGMHYVVKAIEGRIAVLNDLSTVKFEPLTHEAAVEYVKWATDSSSLFFDPVLIEYLLGKIHYNVPYFINLILNDINMQARKINNPEITEQEIDNAFEAIVTHNDYFQDWENRLKQYMTKVDFNFVNELLIHTAHNGVITLQEIYDKAVKHEKTGDYMKFIFDLEKDGYLVAVNEQYRFISPFLGAYWKRNNPV